MNINVIWEVIGGVLAAVIGAWVGYKLQGRGPSDKEIFSSWREAFFRRAFRGQFSWLTGGTNIDNFKDNIQDLMRTLSIGISKHHNVGNRSGGITRIKKKEYYKIALEIYDKLENILKNVNDPTSQYNEDKAKEIDKERDEIILQLNVIWRELKIPEMELPSKTDEVEH